MQVVSYQSLGLFEYAIRVCTDESHTAFEALLPLGCVPHDQDRLAERRRFFLDSAGIGQNEVRLCHHRDKGLVRLRFDQVHITDVGQNALHGFLDIRIQVHGINNVELGMPFGQCAQGRANGLKATTETLTTMPRDQHERALESSEQCLSLHTRLTAFDPVADVEQ